MQTKNLRTTTLFLLSGLIAGYTELQNPCIAMDMDTYIEMERLRAISRTTHKGPPKGRYYYMSDFDPYDSMFEDVPRCSQCEIVDEASAKLRELEDKDIERRWQLRGGGPIHTEEGPRSLTTAYKDFLKEICAERYDGCCRKTTNFTGKADKSRYIGSPTQPDPHIVDKELSVVRTERFWWEGTNDPLAWTPEETPIPTQTVNTILANIKLSQNDTESAITSSPSEGRVQFAKTN